MWVCIGLSETVLYLQKPDYVSLISEIDGADFHDCKDSSEFVKLVPDAPALHAKRCFRFLYDYFKENVSVSTPSVPESRRPETTAEAATAEEVVSTPSVIDLSAEKVDVFWMELALRSVSQWSDQTELCLL